MSAPPRRSILVANRGEIALRLVRAINLSPGLRSIALHTPSERNAAHVHAAHEAVELPLEGPRAYLDALGLVDIAKESNVWGVAVGYGFLSEDSNFAKLLEQAGIVFIGPSPEQLALLGDKISARRLAAQLRVPSLSGTLGEATLDDVVRFAKSQSAGAKVIIKAAAGGGGRGIRVVAASAPPQELSEAYEACRREAKLSFGDDKVFVELFLPRARHIEVQIVGDGKGRVTHLFERECSLQRRNQKLVEIAPSPSISEETRQGLVRAALDMASHVGYRSLGTFEFLVSDDERFFFMEVNPRIQVEATITEEITGVDLVWTQLEIAQGATLTDVGLASPLPPPRRTAIQLRLNAERMLPDGDVAPSCGSLSVFSMPSGKGIRVDTAAHAPLPPPMGTFTVSPAFDSLLAKIIVSASSFPTALRLARTALDETKVKGAATNKTLLRALLDLDDVAQAKMYTTTVAERYSVLFEGAKRAEEEEERAFGGAERARSDGAPQLEAPQGARPLTLPVAGILTSLKLKAGDDFARGQEVALVEAMKTEHGVRADVPGRVALVAVKEGATISAGQVLLFYLPKEGEGEEDDGGEALRGQEEDANVPRPELQEMQRRRSYLFDESRASVQRRRRQGYRTARENLADLVDADSFIEYGDFNVGATNLSGGDEEEHSRQTAGDGVITGWGTVDKALCAVVMAEYTVLAATQGLYHHLKLDRIYDSVLQNPAPCVMYVEGGGGRPEQGVNKVAGLDTPSFGLAARLRTKGIPTIGVAHQYCFAGSAALLGACDIIVATEGTSIGMAGPAMIEAGGLPKTRAEEVGPIEMQKRNGGVDVVANDEADATRIVKLLLSYFTHPVRKGWRYSSDPLSLRTAVPPEERRRRSYDVRKLIATIFDDDSFVELSPEWGRSMVTGFARLEGVAVGVLASDPSSPLGGTVDVNSSLKASRLINLLKRTSSMHLISLADIPGFHVGRDFEESATCGGSHRVFADWFSSAQDFTSSGGRIISVVLRYAFGLGMDAMGGGSSLQNLISASWPSGSLGGMGHEGAVRLGARKMLEAIEDPAERLETERELVKALWKRGRAVNAATLAEIDTVIDPKETRSFLVRALRVAGPRKPHWAQAAPTPEPKL